MCQINTMPMKSQVGYLDVTGKFTFFLIIMIKYDNFAHEYQNE